MRLNEHQMAEAIGQIDVMELRLWVREGWLAPVHTDDGFLFDETDVARARLVCQLRDDLEITDSGIPVVLHLLDQVHGLRRELRALAHVVDQQPDDVRQRIRTVYSSRTRRS